MSDYDFDYDFDARADAFLDAADYAYDAAEDSRFVKAQADAEALRIRCDNFAREYENYMLREAHAL